MLESTPQALVARGIYHMIAIALKAGEYRNVSYVMIAQELADGIAIRRWNFGFMRKLVAIGTMACCPADGDGKDRRILSGRSGWGDALGRLLTWLKRRQAVGSPSEKVLLSQGGLQVEREQGGTGRWAGAGGCLVGAAKLAYVTTDVSEIDHTARVPLLDWL